MRSIKQPGQDDDVDPEDDKKTEIYDPAIDPPPAAPSRPSRPTQSPLPRSSTPSQKSKSQPARVQKARSATLPPPLPTAPKSVPAVPVVTPAQGVPIVQSVSMKGAEDAIIAKPRGGGRPQIPQVKLRSIGSITTESGRIETPKGRLAPPQDPREARRQRLWSNTFWASIAVIIASLVALAIWLIAGKK